MGVDQSRCGGRVRGVGAPPCPPQKLPEGSGTSNRAGRLLGSPWRGSRGYGQISGVAYCAGPPGFILQSSACGAGHREDASMLAFSSDWTTLAGWRGLKTRLNSLRYIKGRVAKPDARHHPVHCTLSPTNQGTKYPTNCAVRGLGIPKDALRESTQNVAISREEPVQVCCLLPPLPFSIKSYDTGFSASETSDRTAHRMPVTKGRASYFRFDLLRWHCWHA